jgi:serine/threonine-protein kinase HipA
VSALLRAVSSAPVIDLARLLDAVILNFLVGNNDAHGKNFSLLYRGTQAENLEVRLAPLYDLVSTLYYPELSRDMAMKIGAESSSETVTAGGSSAWPKRPGWAGRGRVRGWRN